LPWDPNREFEDQSISTERRVEISVGLQIHLSGETMAIDVATIATILVDQGEGGAFLLGPVEATLVVGLQGMEDGWVAPGSQSHAYQLIGKGFVHCCFGYSPAMALSSESQRNIHSTVEL
jgi:hypothetical protein